MAAMLPSMRPMNESTISSAEMSISTPRALVSTILLVRSSCRVMASWSCMSTCMVTSRQSPMRRIGMRSTRLSSRRGVEPRWNHGRARVASSARAKASDRLALVATADRSMPRCTMVCAICGRMPLMMQSAPISCAAATVFSRCWATSVSTVGTPVMSMMAMLEPVATSRCSSVSITTWVRSLSSVPISGSARMPCHSSHHRRRQLDQLFLLAGDDRLTRLLIHLGGVQAQRIQQQRRFPQSCPRTLAASLARLLRRRANSGCLRENTNVATWDGEKPCAARLRDSSARNSRISDQCELRGSNSQGRLPIAWSAGSGSVATSSRSCDSCRRPERQRRHLV